MKLSINRNLVGKGSIFLFANLINAAIPFLLLPVLTQILSPDDYGKVAMFALFLTFTNAFVGLSIHGAVNVQYFKLSGIRFSEYIVNCLILLTISALTIFLIILISGMFLEEILGIPYRWMMIGVITSFFQFLITVHLTLWVVTGSAVAYGFFQVSQSFLNISFSLILISIFGLLWEGRLWGQVISIVLFGVLAFYLIYRSGHLVRPNHIKTDFRNALYFGLPLLPHTLGTFVIYSMDRLLITHLISASAVGVYMVGLQLGLVMGLISDSFNKVYSPWIMKKLSDPQLDKIKLVKYSYLAMLILLIIGGVWAVGVMFFLPWFIGEQFLQAKSLIIFICFGYTFTGLYYIVTNYIFFCEKTKYLAGITFGCALLNIPLTYVLIKKYELVGAALAFLIVQILFFLASWVLSNRVYQMPWLFFIKGKRNA